MTRDGSVIYHRKPLVNNSQSQSVSQCIRPPKLSDISKELRSKIATCHMILKYGESHMSDDERAKHQQRLEKYKRQLANLPATKTHRIKKTYKKMSQEKIREYVLSQIAIAKAKEEWYITADDIAYQLNVKPHFVKQIFQQLNIEGVLSQPIHHAPHDSNRDPWCIGGEKGWMADLYKIIYQEEEIVE